jgi:hypothetical protein
MLSHFQLLCQSHDMTLDEHLEMPTCNIEETMHNKLLKQSGNKMTCFYKVTIDDMIHAFMQTMNYRLWFKGGSTKKGPHSTSRASFGSPPKIHPSLSSINMVSNHNYG